MYSTTQIYLMFLTSMVIFGTNGVIANGIDLPSTQIVLFRSLIGGVLLTAVFLATGHRYTIHHDRKKFTFMILGGICLGITWILLYKSFSLIGVGASYAEYYCAPVLTVLIAHSIFKEKMSAASIAGFTIVVIGSVVMCYSMMGSRGDPAGHIFGLCSAVSQTGVLIFGKLAAGNDPLENCSLQLMVAAGTIAAYSVASGCVPDIGSISNWGNIVVLGAVNTAFCYFLYLTSLARMSSQSSSTLGYLELVSSVLFAALLLGESFSFNEAIGIALILIGAVINSISGKISRKRTPATTRTEAAKISA